MEQDMNNGNGERKRRVLFSELGGAVEEAAGESADDVRNGVDEDIDEFLEDIGFDFEPDDDSEGDEYTPSVKRKDRKGKTQPTVVDEEPAAVAEPEIAQEDFAEGYAPPADDEFDTKRTQVLPDRNNDSTISSEDDSSAALDETSETMILDKPGFDDAPASGGEDAENLSEAFTSDEDSKTLILDSVDGLFDSDTQKSIGQESGSYDATQVFSVDDLHENPKTSHMQIENLFQADDEDFNYGDLGDFFKPSNDSNLPDVFFQTDNEFDFEGALPEMDDSFSQNLSEVGHALGDEGDMDDILASVTPLPPGGGDGDLESDSSFTSLFDSQAEGDLGAFDVVSAPAGGGAQAYDLESGDDWGGVDPLAVADGGVSANEGEDFSFGGAQESLMPEAPGTDATFTVPPAESSDDDERWNSLDSELSMDDEGLLAADGLSFGEDFDESISAEMGTPVFDQPGGEEAQLENAVSDSAEMAWDNVDDFANIMPEAPDMPDIPDLSAEENIEGLPVQGAEAPAADAAHGSGPDTMADWDGELSAGGVEPQWTEEAAAIPDADAAQAQEEDGGDFEAEPGALPETPDFSAAESWDDVAASAGDEESSDLADDSGIEDALGQAPGMDSEVIDIAALAGDDSIPSLSPIDVNAGEGEGGVSAPDAADIDMDGAPDALSGFDVPGVQDGEAGAAPETPVMDFSDGLSSEASGADTIAMRREDAGLPPVGVSLDEVLAENAAAEQQEAKAEDEEGSDSAGLDELGAEIPQDAFSAPADMSGGKSLNDIFDEVEAQESRKVGIAPKKQDGEDDPVSRAEKIKNAMGVTLFITKSGAQRISDALDLKKNWGLYCDLAAAVIFTISTAIIIASIVWY